MLATIDQSALTLLVLCLLLVTIILAVLIFRNEWRMKRLLKGSHIADLEKSLVHTEKELEKLSMFRDATEKKIADIIVNVQKGARGIGVVRFNPFGKKDGGNQSFAAAFVNQDGDGAVLSSLSVRDRVTIFAKPLTRNKSEHELSAEEKKAIQKAHEQYDTK